MRSKTLTFTLTVVLCACLADGAASAKTHTQNISNQSAQAFCDHHGGGTDCTFCDPRHCHVITCTNPGGKCTNDVVDKFRGKPGSIRVPVTGVKAGSAGTPPRTGPRHPVNVGVKNPPTMIKTDPIVTSKHVGMEQGGSHHR